MGSITSGPFIRLFRFGVDDVRRWRRIGTPDEQNREPVALGLSSSYSKSDEQRAAVIGFVVVTRR
jgi:hypothetical protein